MPMCEEQRKEEISKGARDYDYHRSYDYVGIFGVCLQKHYRNSKGFVCTEKSQAFLQSLTH
jgi:hypothetical protein